MSPYSTLFSSSDQSSDFVHMMPANFENGEKCDGYGNHTDIVHVLPAADGFRKR